MPRFPAAVVLAVALAAVAPAQKANREIATYPPEKVSPAPAYLTPVIAPTATSFVVNDDLGLLFALHRPPRAKEAPKPGTTWPQLSYAKLDPAGVPGPFKELTLQKPAALAKQDNYPLALAFHPKLPLLYVWQDVEAIVPRAEATDAPVYKEFDHVLVYHTDGPEPELLMSFGRGERFVFAMPFAAMALPPDGSRLFVGNLRHPVPKTVTGAAVGYFQLAADGLPEFGAEPRKPATDRAGRIAAAKELTAKAATVSDGGLKRLSTNKGGLLAVEPCGLGMASFSHDVLLFGGGHGPVVWEPGNRRAEIQADYIPPFYRPGNRSDLDRLVVHPTLPVIYASTIAIERAAWTDSYLYRVEHADGYPTLLPQRMTIHTFRAATPPVVLPKHNLLALGGLGRVAFVGLDAEGRLTKDRTEVEVHSARVQGLAYSAKFDKLYVAADEPVAKKEPKK